MRTTTLGRSGLAVSRIAFGTWQLGGDWGSFDERAVVETIQRAYDLGITIFDTAQGYGYGSSEELLGRALRAPLTTDRDSVVLATKGGIDPAGERTRDARPAWLRSGVESSLRALGVDHIDLYQVHWPDPDTPAEETATALQELVDAGKIRHVGVSNYDTAQLAAFEAVRPVETLQSPLHLFQREIQDDILPYARRLDIGFLAYSPLGSGLLSGALDASTRFEEGDWRAQSSAFTGDAFVRNLEIVDSLARFAALRSMTVAQLAVAWVLAQEGVHVAIVGARHARNIEAAADAADLRLSAEDLVEIDKITQGATPLLGNTPEGPR
ncbi:aldo/keto reductase [Asanoa sp. WMMD1127]|uniref:aldo/keto reductase n=1 Tax=Asanoa sp. WMMD1127 TaxID=3016107 RepID=UPI002417428B|nr:aldo/keto reductase [Asanoa sp. WMMD1127]MDG4826733.1 aldo/keto reductase [Asanoa sp. WMMD1127]